MEDRFCVSGDSCSLFCNLTYQLVQAEETKYYGGQMGGGDPHAIKRSYPSKLPLCSALGWSPQPRSPSPLQRGEGSRGFCGGLIAKFQLVTLAFDDI